MKTDVLLADSQLAERTLLATALRALPDVRVSEASNGREAVTSLSRATFSAVICPLELEDVRALQLVGLIRGGVCGFPNTPAIVLTDVPDILAAAGAGDPHTFYLRTADPAELADQVLTLVTQRPRPTVLLVEDDVAYAQYCADLLRPFYDLEIRNDGKSALAAWRARRHQVILLDLMLPGLSGEDILRMVAAERPRQPVIILTSNDGPGKHEEMVFGGAAAFLSKGDNTRTIAAAIEAALKEQQCESLTNTWQGQQTRYRSLATRVHAAHYSLTRGQASNASHHLSEALAICPVNGPTDDEWAALLADSELPEGPRGFK
jgi:DNA-binding NarL/FixJ family response regulator